MEAFLSPRKVTIQVSQEENVSVFSFLDVALIQNPSGAILALHPALHRKVTCKESCPADATRCFAAYVALGLTLQLINLHHLIFKGKSQSGATRIGAWVNFILRFQSFNAFLREDKREFLFQGGTLFVTKCDSEGDFASLLNFTTLQLAQFDQGTLPYSRKRLPLIAVRETRGSASNQRPKNSAGKKNGPTFTKTSSAMRYESEIIRSQVQESHSGFWVKAGRLSSCQLERGIRLLLATRSGTRISIHLSPESHTETPLRVVIAFTSPFGLAMVLLGREPEPEVEAVLLFTNLVISAGGSGACQRTIGRKFWGGKCSYSLSGKKLAWLRVLEIFGLASRCIFWHSRGIVSRLLHHARSSLNLDHSEFRAL
ncbi:hypothetical protein Tco_0497375 [Tanacetum coccineum]